MACTELAVTKVLFRKLIMSQAELCLPTIPLLLFREELMLGTCAHLQDPSSPIPTAWTSTRISWYLAIGEKGS